MIIIIIIIIIGKLFFRLNNFKFGYSQSNLKNYLHLSRQYTCWSFRCSWSSADRRCSNYIFILDLTPGLNWAKTAARRDEKPLNIAIWWALYQRFNGYHINNIFFVSISRFIYILYVRVYHAYFVLSCCLMHILLFLLLCVFDSNMNPGFNPCIQDKNELGYRCIFRKKAGSGWLSFNNHLWIKSFKVWYIAQINLCLFSILPVTCHGGRDYQRQPLPGQMFLHVEIITIPKDVCCLFKQVLLCTCGSSLRLMANVVVKRQTEHLKTPDLQTRLLFVHHWHKCLKSSTKIQQCFPVLWL